MSAYYGIGKKLGLYCVTPRILSWYLKKSVLKFVREYVYSMTISASQISTKYQLVDTFNKIPKGDCFLCLLGKLGH